MVIINFLHIIYTELVSSAVHVELVTSEYVCFPNKTVFRLGYTKPCYHPQSATTTHNQPQPPTTTQKSATTTHNHPELATTS